MEKLHSSPSSPRVSPEGIPEGLTRSDSGIPESELSQFKRLERNTSKLIAAAAAGIPASAVLQQPQTAAADSGILESAVLQTQSQPMDGVTDSSVPPEMSQIQEEPEHYSTDSAADSESDSSDQTWRFQSMDVREKRKKERRLARKASQVKGTDSSTAVDTMKPPTKPLLKADVTKNSRTYIWNSGSKKAQFPKNITPPKTMSIEGVDIYLQILTSEEASNCGIMGWDAVLADSKRYCPEIAERKIAQFWAGWRHNRVMARRHKTKTSKTPTTQTSNPAAMAAGPSNNINTPGGEDASKRKRTGTPGSSEPPSKKSLTTGGSYSQAAGASPPPPPTQTLWVHSNDVDKGPIEKDIFFEIVSQCNIIKNQGAIRAEPEFCWKSNLIRQPSYDAENSRGKIVCGDQKTLDFWVKYIPIAAITVCNLNCKAWTWKEYEIPRIRYSFLIPIDTCNGLDARLLVQGTFAVNQLSMSDVYTCRTSYAKTTQQRICNIEVTDQLARAIDDAERVLVGPVCPLHFKLQSGDPEDSGPDPGCPEIQAIQTDDVSQLLDRDSVGESAPDGNFGANFSEILDSSVDPQHPPHPDTGSSTCTAKSVKSGKSVTSLNTAVENLAVTKSGVPQSLPTPTTPPPPNLLL